MEEVAGEWKIFKGRRSDLLNTDGPEADQNGILILRVDPGPVHGCFS